MASTLERPVVQRRRPPRPDAPAASSRISGFFRGALPPFVVFVVFVSVWQAVCQAFSLPRYLYPSPTDIVGAWIENQSTLLVALVSTLMAAVIGFGSAIVVGMAVALIMSQSKLLERSLFPYAVLLQTIPIVAIAPVIVIWVGAGLSAVATIAFIIALFPIITNTHAGLTATDHNLVAMFELYNASWWQRMTKLKFPAALPYIMTGLRISSGLSVIGAIVGEFIAGIGGLKGGIGYVITSAQAQIKMPYLFAAAFTSSILGIVIFVGVSFLSARFLRHWHESAVRRDL
ncbi:MAG: ABC transporter permease [Chloroflexota bacterium]